MAKAALGDVIGSMGKIALSGLGNIAGMGIDAVRNWVGGANKTSTLNDLK